MMRPHGMPITFAVDGSGVVPVTRCRNCRRIPAFSNWAVEPEKRSVPCKPMEMMLSASIFLSMQPGCTQGSASALTKGHVLIADARDLPFTVNVFDAVIAFHVIGHMKIQDRERSVGEAWRVLRYGGCLFFREFSTEDFRAERWLVEPDTFERNAGILTHYFSEPETTGLLSWFTQFSLTTQRWTMPVRGKKLQRAEVVGIFVKPLQPE